MDERVLKCIEEAAKSAGRDGSVLEQYGVNVSLQMGLQPTEALSEPDELIADRVIQILHRRRHANPILIDLSEPQKQAVIQRVAELLANPLTPRPKWFPFDTIYSIDFIDLASKFNNQDQYEEHCFRLLQEVVASEKRIMLLIENVAIFDCSKQAVIEGWNIHERKNIPWVLYSLVRFHTRCIAIASKEEYKKFIQSCAVLDRAVFVTVPSM